MYLYEVKYFYFGPGRDGRYGYVRVQTDSKDEHEISKLAEIEAEREARTSVKIMGITELS